EQLLVGFLRTGLEGRIGEDVYEGDQELVLVANAFDLVVGVEDLTLVQTEALDDVLVGMGMDRLLEGLPQEVLPALRRGDMAVGTQDDIVCCQRIGRDEEA